MICANTLAVGPEKSFTEYIRADKRISRITISSDFFQGIVSNSFVMISAFSTRFLGDQLDLYRLSMYCGCKFVTSFKLS